MKLAFDDLKIINEYGNFELYSKAGHIWFEGKEVEDKEILSLLREHSLDDVKAAHAQREAEHQKTLAEFEARHEAISKEIAEAAEKIKKEAAEQPLSAQHFNNEMQRISNQFMADMNHVMNQNIITHQIMF